MALNINTQDLLNWPGNIKRVTLDQSNIVLTGVEGDEQFVLSFATSAYSDAHARTSIPTLYITTMNTGWCKSSGLTGSSGKFVLTSTAHMLKINIDWTTNSGINGEGYYDLNLSYNSDNTPISGEVIAADMKTKIRSIANDLPSGDEGLQLSYLNASVEYKNGRFFITSGSIGEYFNGQNRTSVTIKAHGVDGAASVLGFNLGLTSRDVDSTSVKEVAVLSDPYVGDTPTLLIGTGTSFSAGDCMMITDGVTKEYFTVLSGSGDSSVTVATDEAPYNYTSITGTYSLGTAKVQLLREQDPEVVPNMFHTTVDSICRHGIKSIINQIDYEPT